MKTKLEEISKTLDGLRAMVDSVLSECDGVAAGPKKWIVRIPFVGGGYREQVVENELCARLIVGMLRDVYGKKAETFQMRDLDCIARGFEMDNNRG
jgi:hypothetical protein